MLSNPYRPTGRVELIAAAPEQEPILANLLELYAHDFSEFHPVELGDDGRFGYKQLPLYWSEPGRHAFLIKVDDRLAGLALIMRAVGYSPQKVNVWDVAEFFIARGYRKRGIGAQAAQKTWRMFPGRWQVRVMESNRPAAAFWHRAITGFHGEAIQPFHIEKGGNRWLVFEFESGSQASDS